MSAPFPPGANTVVRVVLALVGAAAILGATGGFIWVRTPFVTGQWEPVAQPVQFDHRHHVGDDGIDCAYCHGAAFTSPYAGVPPTQRCMNCHSQVWNRSGMTGRVREAYFTNQPIAWRRVNQLPEFVYFDHSIHVNKGVGCVSCHGRVDKMAAVMQDQPLNMQFCLSCHRNPYPNLRPLDRITDMGWQPPANDPDFGKKLAASLDVHPRTDCYTCHR